MLNAHRTLRLTLVAAVLCIAAAPAMAQQGKGAKSDRAATPRAADVDRNGVLMLVRSAILALDQANRTGNYTVLRDLGAPGFQNNSAARLAEIFASHRTQQLDLSGVAAIDPQMTIMPRIEENGMLRLAGFFPSVPNQVDFDLLFAPVNRQWRLFGISVKLSPSQPVAPESEDGPAEVSKEMPDPPAPNFAPLPADKPKT